MNREKLDHSPQVPCLLYLVLSSLHILLVWLLPYFPTQDGPSHVYNLSILHDLLHGGKIWGNYYSYHLNAIPNLGFLAISYPLMHYFTPFVVEKLFISLYILLMTVSVPVFIRTFGKDPLPLSFLVFPVVFNSCFMMGFYSYSIAQPFMLLAIASAWYLRNKQVLCRIITFNIVGIILFYLHMIPFVIFVISFLIMAITKTRNIRNVFKETVLLTASISPMLAIFVNYMIKSENDSFSLLSHTFSFSQLLELIISLFVFSTYSLSSWQMLCCALLLLVLYPVVKAGIIALPGEMKSKPEIFFITLLTLSVTAIYFIMPDDFAGGSYFNQRLVVIIYLLLLPILRIPAEGFLRTHKLFIFVGLSMVFLVTNLVIFRQQSSIIQEFLTGLKADITRGSFIAPYNTKEAGSTPVSPLLHASSYYGVEKYCVDCGNYEARTPYFQIRFKDKLPPMPDIFLLENFPEKIKWCQYPDIKYLLGWKIDVHDRQKLQQNFNLSMTTKNFSLWQRK